MALRDYLPQTLMGRSLLILVVPVILAQIFAVTVFWDNHWDKVTRRLAYAVAGEMRLAVDWVDSSYEAQKFSRLQSYYKDYLGIEVSFSPGNHELPEQGDFNLYDGLIFNPLLNALGHSIPQKHIVMFDPLYDPVSFYEKRPLVYVQLESGVLRFSIPESRLFSSSGYVFVILLVGATFALLLISIIFLRNQIRPIRRLAAAASLMGKGRQVTLGKPRGAKEVRQASEAFETMQRRIRRQIEQRTAMLAGVSHDLRTPLTRVKLGLSMLDNQQEAEAMLDDLAEMEKMVDAYLEFARGEKLEDVTSVNLREFLSDIIANYQSDKLSITYEQSGLEPVLPVQVVNLRRCIENILSNAARYASKIKVTLNMTEERVYLSIEDNGPGIPEDQYEEVFKPFVRLDPSRSKNTGGAGLGLSVAMDIVLSHGGKISLGKSESLGGLEVSIRLPV